MDVLFFFEAEEVVNINYLLETWESILHSTLRELSSVNGFDVTIVTAGQLTQHYFVSGWSQ